MNKRAACLLSAVVLGAAPGIIGGTATGAEIRTETDLGGFSITSNAAPFKVLVDDPSNPLPRPEESAIVEANPAYTQVDLATGPAARAIASSLWPGNLLGQGIPTATNNELGQYPIKAQAQYPDKPYESNASIDLRGNHITDDQGLLMRSTARGLDATALAKFNPTDVPGQLELGTLWSQTTATVTDKNVAVGHSISRLSDVSLLGGMIRVGSVSTVVQTTSDGKKPTSTGTTTVVGLLIGGQGFTVDEKGAHPVETGPLGFDGPQALKDVGIHVDGIVQKSSKDSESATRVARGLRITVDTTALREVLTTKTPGPVSSALYEIFNRTPQGCPGGAPIPLGCPVQGALYYSLSGTPKITFIMGAGESSTSAIESIGFDFPSLDVPTDFQGGFDGAVNTGGAQAPTLPGTDIIAPTMPEAGPATGDPAGQPVLAGSRPNLPSSPAVSALLVLGALLAAGVGGFGLTWLRGFAFGGGLLGGGCALGAPSNVPSLHMDGA